MKILIFAAVHERQDITELFLMGVERLRLYSGHQIDLFCVCSSETDSKYLKSKNVEHCIHENKPLSLKMEFGFKEAIKKDFDYLLRMGSDDLLDHEVFPKYYNELMTKGVHYFGLKMIGAVNSNTLDSCIYKYNYHRNDMILGGGSMMSRWLCDKFKDKPLYSIRKLSQGLDLASEKEIKKVCSLHPVRTDKPMLVDIKSKINI